MAKLPRDRAAHATASAQRSVPERSRAPSPTSGARTPTSLRPGLSALRSCCGIRARLPEARCRRRAPASRKSALTARGAPRHLPARSQIGAPRRKDRGSAATRATRSFLTTTGRKVLGLRPGGWMTTSNVSPARALPLMLWMKGFHSGYRAKSIRRAHTRDPGAAIVVVAAILRLKSALPTGRSRRTRCRWSRGSRRRPPACASSSGSPSPVGAGSPGP